MTYFYMILVNKLMIFFLKKELEIKKWSLIPTKGI